MAPGAWSKRFALAAAGVLLALGFHAASAPSQTAAEIQLVTAGPGVLTISPAETGPKAECKVDGQQYVDPATGELTGDETPCIHHLEPGTRVTLTAVPDKGHSFVGWSDFACSSKSTRCTLTLAGGARYVTARFSPVTLTVYGTDEFGLISVKPKPSSACSLNDGEPCEYKSGTTITLSREFAGDGFWIGACTGNEAGVLDDDECRLRLTSNEVVGAGYPDIQQIPPPLGSGIAVVVSGRGKVTGGVINGTQTLNCGTRCLITELKRYDYVRLTATASKGSHFARWSNLSQVKTQVVPVSSTNRIQAVFVRN
jgi:hypothetical protein